ncbi:MAG: HIRAN domain-containing protein [Flavobacteriales bacterium]|jgi:hypothetical protein|nr:HIRAN domain-containing protein [Flavobacteriales bacterium]
MNRLEFLQNLGLGAGGLLLPKHLIKRSEIKIYDNYIRGMHHYQYQEIRKQIQIGNPLILERDAENIYDSYAVAIFWNDAKLGYLPAYENIVIANVLDNGVELKAQIIPFTVLIYS